MLGTAPRNALSAEMGKRQLIHALSLFYFLPALVVSSRLSAISSHVCRHLIDLWSRRAAATLGSRLLLIFSGALETLPTSSTLSSRTLQIPLRHPAARADISTSLGHASSSLLRVSVRRRLSLTSCEAHNTAWQAVSLSSTSIRKGASLHLRQAHSHLAR